MCTRLHGHARHEYLPHAPLPPMQTQAAAEVHHVFAEGGHLTSAVYLTRNMFLKEGKSCHESYEYTPDEKSHGTSIQRQILQHDNNGIPTFLG